MRSAGIILELQKGRPKDYEELMRRCERKIPLKESDIPSLRIKKTRSEGVLIEFKGEEQEEKADKLMDKEIIKDIDDARVWRPSRRLKLRLIGLPIGARPWRSRELLPAQETESRKISGSGR